MTQDKKVTWSMVIVTAGDEVSKLQKHWKLVMKLASKIRFINLWKCFYFSEILCCGIELF